MRRKICYAVMMAVLCVAGWHLFFSFPQEAHEVQDPPVLEKPQEQLVYVYVSGAVKKPGLYAFSEVVRIGDAVHEAGDELPYADVHAVNYADPVQDGMHIHLPYDLQGLPAAEAESNGLININQADEARLTELPGIGPAMAQQIIAYRKEHGAFSEVEELQKVKGIGAAKYKKIQHKVTI